MCQLPDLSHHSVILETLSRWFRYVRVLMFGDSFRHTDGFRIATLVCKERQPVSSVIRLGHCHLTCVVQLSKYGQHGENLPSYVTLHVNYGANFLVVRAYHTIFNGTIVGHSCDYIYILYLTTNVFCLCMNLPFLIPSMSTIVSEL